MDSNHLPLPPGIYTGKVLKNGHIEITSGPYEGAVIEGSNALKKKPEPIKLPRGRKG